jgi:hypothetical protein
MLDTPPPLANTAASAFSLASRPLLAAGPGDVQEAYVSDTSSGERVLLPHGRPLCAAPLDDGAESSFECESEEEVVIADEGIVGPIRSFLITPAGTGEMLVVYAARGRDRPTSGAVLQIEGRCGAKIPIGAWRSGSLASPANEPSPSVASEQPSIAVPLDRSHLPRRGAA